MANRNEFTTRLPEEAIFEALTLLPEKLPLSSYSDIENYNKEIEWAGELFEGSISEIEILLMWNLLRIQQFPGFIKFYVGLDNNREFYVNSKKSYITLSSINIDAEFPNMLDGIKLCRTESRFFVFGNKSFTRPPHGFVSEYKEKSQIGNSTNRQHSKPSGTSSNCFIATAVYGSPFSSEVMQLRHFRDSFFLHCTKGRYLISLYERLSPPVAAVIEIRPWLRLVVRYTVIVPLIMVSKIIVTMKEGMKINAK